MVNTEKLVLRIEYFFETASVEDIQEFHMQLSSKNHDHVFDELLEFVTNVLDEKRGVLQ